MRKYFYTPESQENLADLDALDDIDAIDATVRELAADRSAGYLIPLQSPFLSRDRQLYRYQVGRYKLNFTLSQTELIVVSVMI